jgi:hypothetical protein
MSSESNSTSSTLSDFDSQVLYFFGLDIIQDALGVIWETLFISGQMTSVFVLLTTFEQVHMGSSLELLSIPSCNASIYSISKVLFPDT